MFPAFRGDIEAIASLFAVSLSAILIQAVSRIAKLLLMIVGKSFGDACGRELRFALSIQPSGGGEEPLNLLVLPTLGLQITRERAGRRGARRPRPRTLLPASGWRFIGHPA